MKQGESRGAHGRGTRPNLPECPKACIRSGGRP
ncbi:MAG: hypothetical protein ACD_76C00002G0001, partial [uncultured bacterium]